MSANHRSGIAKASPIKRPKTLCSHSQKKIRLKSCSSIQKCFERNSGDALYNSKIRFHSVSPIGGRKPIIGRHSTIDKPESVSLVIAPMMTIRPISAQHTKSHVVMA